jgi:hypothetical protein
VITTSDTEISSEEADEEERLDEDILLDIDILLDDDALLELEDGDPPSVTDKTRINKIVKTTALESLGCLISNNFAFLIQTANNPLLSRSSFSLFGGIFVSFMGLFSFLRHFYYEEQSTIVQDILFKKTTNI